MVAFKRDQTDTFGVLKIKDGIIEFADNNASRLLMLSQTELSGQSLAAVLPEYDMPIADSRLHVHLMDLKEKRLQVTGIWEESPSKYLIVILNHPECKKFRKNDTVISANYSHKFVNIIESLFEGVLITDGKGTILRISVSFQIACNVTADEVEGKTVFEMEKRGLFNPSVTAIVLKTRQKETISQEIRQGVTAVVTAIPFFNASGEIEYVVSFSRDLADYLKLKNEHEKLSHQIDRYSSEIQLLRGKEMRFPTVVSKSPAMNNILKLVMKVAAVEINLIITGESGVGKTLIARLIHQHSSRCKGPFVEINCGAIPENLLESELFGYVSGAFTGASDSGKIGMIELAENGTLFLDEIGELSLQLQVKLLNVIQEKKLKKIGSSRSVKVDFRLISASNKDLESMVKVKKFRKDLYYRLSVVPIQIPPLRERKEDTFALLSRSLKDANHRYKVNKRLSNRATDALLNYHWPGNVRELENLIERLVVTIDNERINWEDLPDDILPDISFLISERPTLKTAVYNLEKQMVQWAYENCKTTVEVGKLLGISQPTATRKLKKHIKGPFINE